MVALQLPFQRVVDGPVLKLFGQAESRCHTLNRPGSELVPDWQAEEVVRYLTRPGNSRHAYGSFNGNSSSIH
jgi:hypothetical protein